MITSERLKEYLQELRHLSVYSVSQSDILALADAKPDRAHFRSVYSQLPTHSFEVDFQERLSLRFAAFVKSCSVAAPGPIVLWTEKSAMFGPLLLPRLEDVNWHFPFETNIEGIFSVRPRNHNEQLIVEFSRDNSDVEKLEVTAKGNLWSKVTF